MDAQFTATSPLVQSVLSPAGGMMPEPLSLNPSRKRGLFEAPQPEAKRHASQNSEYVRAFQAFDGDGSNTIDLVELQNCLSHVQQTTEGTGVASMFMEPFSLETIMWLTAKFSPFTNEVQLQQFCEMMQYIEQLKVIFAKVDTDRSGDVDVAELARALAESGFTMSTDVARQILRNYMKVETGTMKFGDFVKMRLEWDAYISAWESAVAPGADRIPPERLLTLLESIKKSVEPVGHLMGQSHFASVGQDYLSRFLYASQFSESRPFMPRTCEMLIMRFGLGQLWITFDSFCMMMEFIKDKKATFIKAQGGRGGALDLQGLHTALTQVGLPLSYESVTSIGGLYDTDKSGAIEFDEYLQLMTEWTELIDPSSFGNAGARSTATATELQQALGEVRVFYNTIAGTMVRHRPFSIYTCRLLIAMYGTCGPNEMVASRVTYAQFLQLAEHLKMAAYKYASCDMNGDGQISCSEMQVALARGGVNLTPEAVQSMIDSYDLDANGMLEFDEFLQLLLAAQIQTKLFSMLPGYNAGTGTTTLDMSMLFRYMCSLPRAVMP
eukprot:TRINITY_DN16103_c6_g1_i1.p1 TRINITY_DN16103_c6_g1~~TRINITY_DN16103_c6_g1_i1.p1  ORF type:complete len:579 (-),score=86.38 TRINITY_DN16103_c6_g1_i1:56-1714(-)